jgi:hypothetical protein
MRCQLITPYYRSGHEQRDAELEQCERLNREAFGRSAVVYVGGDRPTFQYLFDLCDPDCVNIIANSDIYFAKPDLLSIATYYHDESTHGTCMALSRWDITDRGPELWDHKDSQDVWVFYGRPVILGADFNLGIPGCDNRIAKVIEEAGYTVINPSKTIRSYHLHASGFRTYGTGRGGAKMERIPGPYKFIQPHTL